MCVFNNYNEADLSDRQMILSDLLELRTNKGMSETHPIHHLRKKKRDRKDAKRMFGFRRFYSHWVSC